MKPGKCVDRIERIRAVEREYQVAMMATTALMEVLDHKSYWLAAQELHRADLKAFQIRLEDTYLIRLFAEFETALRDYWRNGRRKQSHPPVRDVIDSLASQHRVLDAVRANVHAVRKYRNALVHEEDAGGKEVDLRSARGYLCRFLGFLPPDW